MWIQQKIRLWEDFNVRNLNSLDTAFYQTAILPNTPVLLSILGPTITNISPVLSVLIWMKMVDICNKLACFSRLKQGKRKEYIYWRTEISVNHKKYLVKLKNKIILTDKNLHFPDGTKIDWALGQNQGQERH